MQTTGRCGIIARGIGSVKQGSPNATNANNVRNVNIDGTLNNNNAYNGNNGAAPDQVQLLCSLKTPEGVYTHATTRKHARAEYETLVTLMARYDLSALSEDTLFIALYYTYVKTLAGKRHRTDTVRYEQSAPLNLLQLTQQLSSNSYHLGGYNRFTIYEPKERTIWSISFKDKIVQRFICDFYLEPTLEPKFIDTSFACRRNKGTSAGLTQTKKYMVDLHHKYGLDYYILKCDIAKYFESIRHDLLVAQIHKLKLPHLVTDLLIRIVYSHPEKRGLPLGNQTSQWLSVNHLNAFDHYVVRVLKCDKYVRYMDDFVIMSHDKDELREIKKAIELYLDKLSLKLNDKSHIIAAKNGIDFLGFNLKQTSSAKVCTKLRRSSSQRMRRTLRHFKKMYALGYKTKDEIMHSYSSWRGHASQGNTYKMLIKFDLLFLSIFEGDEDFGEIIKIVNTWRYTRRTR